MCFCSVDMHFVIFFVFEKANCTAFLSRLAQRDPDARTTKRDSSAGVSKEKAPTRGAFSFGAPAGIRIPDTLIKSQVLYRLSYRGI